MASIKNTIKKNNISKVQKNLKTKSLKGSKSKNRPNIEQSKKKRNTQKSSKRSLKKSGGAPKSGNKPGFFARGLASARKNMGRMAAEARGAAEGVAKGAQLAIRGKQIGSIYAFMPNYVEVVGRSLTGTGGGEFTKDLYVNLMDNLVTLASIDSITLKRMLLVNPEDIADYTRAYKHISKKGPSINVNSNQSVFNHRQAMGIKIKERTEGLKKDMQSIVSDSDIVRTSNANVKPKYRAFKGTEIDDIMKPDKGVDNQESSQEHTATL